MTAPTKLPLLEWQPINKVLPFPLVRRRDLVARTAHSVAFRRLELGSRDPAATGEKLLQAALKKQRETLMRRGVDPAAVERELRQLEAAVRVMAARLQQEGQAS